MSQRWGSQPLLPPAQVVPWHQDNGYLAEEALATMMPTAWIPLLDTGRENGGMELLARSHQKVTSSGEEVERLSSGCHSGTSLLCWGYLVSEASTGHCRGA